ncbi:hypothetical protein BJ944DRAFT_170069 [Cunninghamella echinulata]|nr:hypothetical protein BJ944DRAFT_170069 [Cunninghamella echinulata]
MANTIPNPYTLVIAYDFGTTYSGAAYSFTDGKSDVYNIQNWQNKSFNYYQKVPTLLLYERSNPTKLVTWGYEAEAVMRAPRANESYIALSKFKLHLDSKFKRSPLENGLTAVKAVADYLRELHNYVLEDIKRRYTGTLDPFSIRYCVTVPAIYDDKAKHCMRAAALMAGIIQSNDRHDKLLLISEPEAAALHCEKMFDYKVMNLGTTTDRLMICDAGGGTVDITVFEVDGPSQLREITKGIGSHCGSIFLDSRFNTLLNIKLGGQISCLNSVAKSFLMDQFIEKIKPAFDGKDDMNGKYYYLHLPASINLDLIMNHEDLDGSALILHASELKEKVFDPVIKDVLKLLERQMNELSGKQLSYLLLVGGFGSSRYLYQCVQQAFSNRVRHILCPNLAEMAIVRGAVYFGLNPRSITSRISRRTYGINAGLPFEPGKDPLSTRVIRPDGTERCPTRFLAFVKKNDQLPLDYYVTKSMITYYGKYNEVYIFLYSTENDQVPRYYDEPGVSRLATLSVPIPTLPNRKVGEQVTYHVRFYFGMTEIKVEADFGNGNSFQIQYHFDNDEYINDPMAI